MALTSTTLVTFLYQSPRHVSRVELLGSWDNFSKPYPMQRDKSVSSKNWKGCHSFEDIVCDGDVVAMDGSTRNGGLQMGGTYWYYYRLDDESECFDPKVASTRGCPFLPGQEVNLLEVPVQKDTINGGSPLSSSNIFTLDPTAKFITPTQSPIRPTYDEPNSPTKALLSRTSSLKTNFFSAVPRFSLSRTRSAPTRRRLTTGHSMFRSACTAYSEVVRPFTENDAHGRQDYCSTLMLPQVTQQEFTKTSTAVSLQGEFLLDSLRSYPTIEEVNDDLNFLNLDDASSIFTDEAVDCEFEVQEPTQDTGHISSSRMSGVPSLITDSTIGSPTITHRHSFHQPQPQSPSLPNFEPFLLEPLQLDLPFIDNTPSNIDLSSESELLGPYLHADKDCSSTVTLRPMPSPLKDLNHTAILSPLEKLDMVESWRHGESPSTVPETESSSLQDFINDLGYLSSMIH